MLTQFLVGSVQTTLEAGVVWVDGGSLLEVSQGCRCLARLVGHDAEQVERPCMLRIRGEQLAEHELGLLELAGVIMIGRPREGIGGVERGCPFTVTPAYQSIRRTRWGGAPTQDSQSYFCFAVSALILTTTTVSFWLSAALLILSMASPRVETFVLFSTST